MAEVLENGGAGVAGNGGAGVKSKRDEMAERMRARYAERDFENEDDMYGQAMLDWDEMEDKVKKSDEENKRAMEALEKCPAAMMFLSAILNGGEEVEALADLKDYFDFSEEEKAAHNEKLRRQREDAEAARAAAEAYRENWGKSADALAKWAEENGLTVEDACQMVNDFIEKIAMKFRNGTLDKDVFETIFRLLNYDKDIAAAKEAGRKEGVNEGIRRKAEKKAGDGLPRVAGGGGAKAESQPKPNNLLERLREVNNSRGVLD